jgi:hypothetical protein
MFCLYVIYFNKVILTEVTIVYENICTCINKSRIACILYKLLKTE